MARRTGGTAAGAEAHLPVEAPYLPFKAVPHRLRQTPSLLPVSGFVLLTIRSRTCPPSRVAAQPGGAARLAEAVRVMPGPVAACKSLPPFDKVLLGLLGRQAGGRQDRLGAGRR